MVAAAARRYNPWGGTVRAGFCDLARGGRV